MVLGSGTLEQVVSGLCVRRAKCQVAGCQSVWEEEEVRAGGRSELLLEEGMGLSEGVVRPGDRILWR